MTGNARWANRLSITSNAVHIGGFLVAVVTTAATDGITAQALTATLLTAIGLVLSYFVSIPIGSDARRQIVALIAATTMFVFAIAITGGVNSPFVIMPIASIFLASFAGGMFLAIPVTLLSIVGVLVTSLVNEDAVSVGAFIRIPVIYVITAVAFSEVERALQSEVRRADDLAFVSTTARERRERLEETHDLLEDLLRVATSPDVNAFAAAQDALRATGVVLPSSRARIVSSTGVHLARRGDTGDDDPTESISIQRNGRTLAQLDLWLDGESLTPRHRAAVEQSVESVGLALENDAMVQQLAGLAIQRERVRLARELHDDVAPSIASVGLALDMVLLTDGMDAEQTRTLEATRSNVTHLVDRVRDRVQDLRADRTMSVVEIAHSLVAEVDTDGPAVIVDIEERTPPRPAIAMEVSALVTEAFRNAVAHSRASTIRIGGKVDAVGGSIVVEDNGVGFDPDDAGTDRFGLTGMRERAHLIGGDLDVITTPGSGTTVTIRWRDVR